MRKTICLLAAVLTLCTACEKGIPDSDADVGDQESNVTLRFSPYVTESFATTRGGEGSSKPIQEVCSRLSIAIFNANGSKVVYKTQEKDDEGFGTANLNLAEGTYEVVAIGHNGKGTATITSTEKVTFPSNKMTDTFYYYGTLVVTDEPQEQTIPMTRCVAMFRLNITDPTPEIIKNMKFYYTGGSSTFSPKAGFGCVKSKQTEILEVNSSGVYEVYTMPHATTGTLKMIISALDSEETLLYEKVFEDIPVKVNNITSYTGSFFDGSSGTITANNFGITIDPTWEGTNNYDF